MEGTRTGGSRRSRNLKNTSAAIFNHVGLEGGNTLGLFRPLLGKDTMQFIHKIDPAWQPAKNASVLLAFEQLYPCISSFHPGSSGPRLIPVGFSPDLCSAFPSWKQSQIRIVWGSSFYRFELFGYNTPLSLHYRMASSEFNAAGIRVMLCNCLPT